MVDSPDEYEWSSWHSTLGEKEVPDWLAIDQTLLPFGHTRAIAKQRYQQFVLDGVSKGLWHQLKQQMYLGSDDFVNQHLPNKDLEVGDMQEIPAKQRRAKPLSLEEYEHSEPNRDSAIVAAFTSGGYTQKQIGNHFGIHYSRVSRIVSKRKV